MTTPRLPSETQIFIVARLVLATLLGGAVGYERQRSGHPAGLRTNVLVCIGAALFGLIPTLAYPSDPSQAGRVWQNVLTGVGFLSAGVVIKEKHGVHGLTTAAGVWAVSAIGLACAAGLYFLATTGTMVVLGTLWGLLYFERRMQRKGGPSVGKVGGNGHEQQVAAAGGSRPEHLAR
jgi:putative Mg2+ transporter-C (MgtC) family protein